MKKHETGERPPPRWGRRLSKKKKVAGSRKASIKKETIGPTKVEIKMKGGRVHLHGRSKSQQLQKLGAHPKGQKISVCRTKVQGERGEINTNTKMVKEVSRAQTKKSGRECSFWCMPSNEGCRSRLYEHKKNSKTSGARCVG